MDYQFYWLSSRSIGNLSLVMPVDSILQIISTPSIETSVATFKHINRPHFIAKVSSRMDEKMRN
jgi:hypothetical protein